eukprot:CAMPEP_0176047516 /NCGR_PEP_ID=MMETSP0120_2-20121206/23599_1 /TAXON_ID=160619 /ORGANISM="Kryptoperidinium foliaceum, Strain CCMP 1326" /LENGTH=51 /DNA_ID=CAMNT_0017380931 /DNA_START=121 /DNA_END=276 /DNA_ORIENTATION=-
MTSMLQATGHTFLHLAIIGGRALRHHKLFSSLSVLYDFDIELHTSASANKL